MRPPRRRTCSGSSAYSRRSFLCFMRIPSPFQQQLQAPPAKIAGARRRVPSAAAASSPHPNDATVEAKATTLPAVRACGMSVGGDAVARSGHRLCHRQRLLKLKVCIVRPGRFGFREILWRLARNRLGDRWQIGARNRLTLVVPPTFFSAWVRLASCSGSKLGTSLRVSATGTSGSMPCP